MKVFLMSDLVVHELVSMRLEGKWLTSAQFAESAQLWISRHGQRNQLSRRMFDIFQHEAEQIAGRLMKEVLRDGTDSPLKRLLLDISAVNYADPLSASALAASLEVCRTKLCDCCSPNTEPGDAKESDEPERWRCHPALRQFLCGTVAAHETGNGDGCSEAVLAANVREH
ncbi:MULTISPECIES: hypothetical protein [Paraburkholderia]|uniref:Uncharacterized protein n=1 Tax=Paraburkholderia largidicola TaxID=3014751 RepID=A0A7I8BLK3_9BURK|nr:MULTISPECIES: hypothetical protein [Paraburkholderia]BCF89646.1 hypothetical protein PPGU16_27130 [Paraburkholderia sp. PGU16]CAG9266965.1 conserved hypothetical protein [Paraburkholderia caribensis]